MPELKTHDGAGGTYSLFEFVRVCVRYAAAHGITSFPSPNSLLWHQWLYAVSKRTTMVSGMEQFDWDGPYPKHPRWPETIAGMMFWFQERMSDQRLVMFEEEAERSRKIVNSLSHEHYGLASFGFAQADCLSGFFEKEKIKMPAANGCFRVSVSVAVFIADDEGKLLMVRRADADDGGGLWGFPAGSMDAHEDPIMAARREAKEETGFEIELIDLLRVVTIDRGNAATGLAFTFRARIAGGALLLPANEISECRYFFPAEIEEMLLRGKVYKPEYNRANLKHWRERRSYPLDAIRPIAK